MIHWQDMRLEPRSDGRGMRPKYRVVCEECGKERWLRKGDIKSIGPRHWCLECGMKLAHWKGGRRIRPDGYIRVAIPKTHPHPSEKHNGTWYMLEHRLVMERHLGRYLEPGEIVHHIDGNPSNNAIENLRLCESQAEHMRREHGKGDKDTATCPA